MNRETPVRQMPFKSATIWSIRSRQQACTRHKKSINAPSVSLAEKGRMWIAAFATPSGLLARLR
jgi:hypothetical protein